MSENEMTPPPEDPRTATVPVILLSARAGEESRVEGLAAGADDYLVKPFSARELAARVESHLKLARLRQEEKDRSDADLEAMAARLPIVTTRVAGAETLVAGEGIGFVVANEDDMIEFEAALTMLLEDPRVCGRMAASFILESGH